MTDIKELRRLAEAGKGMPRSLMYPEIANFTRACDSETILSLLDKIDAQEIEIKWLKKAIDEAYL